MENNVLETFLTNVALCEAASSLRASSLYRVVGEDGLQESICWLLEKYSRSKLLSMVDPEKGTLVTLMRTILWRLMSRLVYKRRVRALPPVEGVAPIPSPVEMAQRSELIRAFPRVREAFNRLTKAERSEVERRLTKSSRMPSDGENWRPYTAAEHAKHTRLWRRALKKLRVWLHDLESLVI